MNTYSLKPQHDQVPPRIHVLSIQSTLPEEPEEEDEAGDQYVQEAESVRGDAESIITALPAFPLPPVSFFFFFFCPPSHIGFQILMNEIEYGLSRKPNLDYCRVASLLHHTRNPRP